MSLRLVLRVSCCADCVCLSTGHSVMVPFNLTVFALFATYFLWTSLEIIPRCMLNVCYHSAAQGVFYNDLMVPLRLMLDAKAFDKINTCRQNAIDEDSFSFDSFLACRSRQASIVLEWYFRFEVSLLSFYACERDGPIRVSGGSDIIP